MKKSNFKTIANPIVGLTTALGLAAMASTAQAANVSTVSWGLPNWLHNVSDRIEPNNSQYVYHNDVGATQNTVNSAVNIPTPTNATASVTTQPVQPNSTDSWAYYNSPSFFDDYRESYRAALIANGFDASYADELTLEQMPQVGEQSAPKLMFNGQPFDFDMNQLSGQPSVVQQMQPQQMMVQQIQPQQMMVQQMQPQQIVGQQTGWQQVGVLPLNQFQVPQGQVTLGMTPQQNAQLCSENPIFHSQTACQQ